MEMTCQQAIEVALTLEDIKKLHQVSGSQVEAWEHISNCPEDGCKELYNKYRKGSGIPELVI